MSPKPAIEIVCATEGVTIMPCPFCDHEDVEVDEVAPGQFAIDCPECGAIGPILDTVSTAIELWNAPHGKSFKLARLIREAARED